MKQIHPSWMPHLKPLFDLPPIKEFISQVVPAYPNNIFPKVDDIFNVFSMPLGDIKVVILGQDPYPKPNQATGWAFAVNPPTHKPASFRIIEEELWNEYHDVEGVIPYSLDSTLKPWIDQGVFLLNTALTVREGQPNSHQDNWKGFIKGVIEIISKEVTPIWMLWGANAKSYKDTITGANMFKSHNILTASHPASEAYKPGQGGFYGCNHFIKANTILEQSGETPIKWV